MDLEKCREAIQRCFSRRATILDPAAWEAVLADEDFQDLMEEARKRNFSNLATPQVPELFSTIRKFLSNFKFEAASPAKKGKR